MKQQEKERQAIIDSLIGSICINKANLEHISETGKINGSLYLEISRVMRELSGLRKPIESEMVYTGKGPNPHDMCDILNYEPIGQADEELVQKILNCIESKKWKSLYHQQDMLHSNDFNLVATEIAKLLPSSRSQENGVNDSFRANRFIQAMINNGFKLSSEDQIKIEQLYISVI